ncbi:hypothetical protein G6F59_015944 [Rhizopus arrhizus]|nr:hypothetical protein G6F59_015944 [Rhizopus arrhizus]
MRLQRQRFGEAVYPGFRCGIVGLSERALAAVHGRDVHDAAPSAVRHAAAQGLRHVEHRIQVAVHHFGPVFEAHLAQPGVTGDAGVVDQDVDLAAVAFQPPHQRLARGVVAHVHLIDGEAPSLGRFFVDPGALPGRWPAPGRRRR